MMQKKAMCMLLFVLLASGTLLPQETPEKPIREKVDVVAVEVPVRVYLDGNSVTNLTKENFTLYEDGKEQLISDFFITSKKIAVTTPQENQETSAQLPRFFVLVFRCYDFNDSLKSGLDYSFANILRPSDQLVVFINNSTLKYAEISNMHAVQQEIETVLRRECQQAKLQMMSYLRQVEQETKQLKLKLDMSSGRTSDTRPSQIAFYLKMYNDLWKEYKKRFLDQNLGSYYQFANLLEQEKKQKWVLNFYQMEMVPKMSLGKDILRVLNDYVNQFRTSTVPEEAAASITIAQALQDIDRSFNVCADFPSEQVAKLFYKVNATFHTIFLKVQMESFDEDIEFRHISTDIENTLRQITRQTGGDLITSNDISKSLSQISEVEDQVYMLAYHPKNKKRIGKLKVKLDNRRYRLMYDDNQRDDYIRRFIEKQEQENPSLKFNSLEFQNKTLRIVIGNIGMVKSEGKTLGKIEVHIQIKAENDQIVFDKSRQMETLKEPVSISLDFKSLIPGRYNILVTARDLLSGKSCQDLLQPSIR